ncbi:hypothetical protein D3C72_1875270 [compost metagenome]
MLYAGTPLFRDFGGNQAVEIAVARGFAPRLRQRGALRRQRGQRLLQGQRVAVAVDLEQDFALLHMLVVARQYACDQPGHIGRHLDDVGTHMAVAGPWRGRVVVPQVAQHQQGGDGCQQRWQQGKQGAESEGHDGSPGTATKTAATAPRTIT